MSDAERKNQTQLKSIAPQFAPDVIAAAEYYRDILGFRILGYFGQPRSSPSSPATTSKFS